LTSSRYPLDEIRDRCSILDVVSPYVALKRSGKNYKGLCPFHTEKTPSFMVNPDTQRWKCFGCGASGDVFTFVMQMEQLTFAEAVEQLAAKVGVKITYDPQESKTVSERNKILRINSAAAQFFQKSLEQSANARDYVKQRGISNETAKKFKLGYAPADWQALADYLRGQGIKPEDAAKAGLLIPRESGQGFYDRFRNRLIFPIQDVQDRIIAFGGRALGDESAKYINSPESMVFAKNRILYALNFARKAIAEKGFAIIVEGYMDILAAHEAGITNAVATMGTALTLEHVRLLGRYTKKAVLAFDADSAGMAAAIRGGPMFDEAEFDVRIVPMPSGEDPDSFIRKSGPAAFLEAVAEALPIPDYRISVIASKHNINTKAGKLALLNEVMPIIAEVDKQIERERLISLVSPYHPNFGSGIAPAEVHIRQEIERLRRKKEQSAYKKDSAEDSEAEKIGQAELISNEGKAVRKAEKELLSFIIRGEANAADIFEKVSPEYFVGEDSAELAKAIKTEVGSGGSLDINSLAAKIAGSSAEGLLNELLVAESENLPLDDLIAALTAYRRREQEKRFRLLADKIERGEIKRTDKEFSEYWQLVRELHN